MGDVGSTGRPMAIFLWLVRPRPTYDHLAIAVRRYGLKRHDLCLARFLTYAMVEADVAFTPVQTATFLLLLVWIYSTGVLKPWFEARCH